MPTSGTTLWAHRAGGELRCRAVVQHVARYEMTRALGLRSDPFTLEANIRVRRARGVRPVSTGLRLVGKTSGAFEPVDPPSGLWCDPPIDGRGTLTARSPDDTARSPDAAPARAVRVLVVSEFRLLGEGIVVSFDRDEAIEVTGVACGVREAVALAARNPPDVVLLDMSARSAPTLARRLSAVAPEATLIALAIEDSPGSVAACAEAGIAGYVPRTATLDLLRDTVLRVSRGESPCSPRAAAGLFSRVAALAAERDRHALASRLTRRELEVLDLLESGRSNREIASRLSIALPTVKNHVHHILSKLDARRRGEAVALRRD